MTDLTVVPVDRRNLAAFIRLPGRLAARDPQWIEPLWFERRQFLSPTGNPFFDHAEVALWLALADGRPVGRISAQIDRLAPAVAGRTAGAFGLIDARDPAVLAALFAQAEGWLAARGAGLVRGPLSLSINQTSGLLVDGFDTPPFVMMDHHDPWLGPAIEALGYAKAKDLLAYMLHLAQGLPDRHRALVARAGREVTLRPLDMRRFRAEISTVTTIFNEAWRDNWGFVPLTEAEIDAMARELKPILHADLVWIAELAGRPAAFIVLLPNINAAIGDLGGRLLPLGWAKLLWRLKVRGIRSGRVPLMGVRRDLADTMLGKLLPMMLIYALEGPARARGIDAVELSWLLEDNWPMRRMIEGLGATVSKTYRVYEKALA